MSRFYNNLMLAAMMSYASSHLSNYGKMKILPPEENVACPFCEKIFEREKYSNRTHCSGKCYKEHVKNGYGRKK